MAVFEAKTQEKRDIFIKCMRDMIKYLQMEKDFDQWNKLKKKIHNSNEILESFPREGEVWVCTLGWNIGREQNGAIDGFSRPVLIVKKFNNQMFWIVPLSTKQKPYDFYFNFTDPKGEKVSIILAQLRLLSVKRFGRLLYLFPQEKFEQVVLSLKKFFP